MPINIKMAPDHGDGGDPFGPWLAPSRFLSSGVRLPAEFVCQDGGLPPTETAPTWLEAMVAAVIALDEVEETVAVAGFGQRWRGLVEEVKRRRWWGVRGYQQWPRRGRWRGGGGGKLRNEVDVTLHSDIRPERNIMVAQAGTASRTVLAHSLFSSPAR